MFSAADAIKMNCVFVERIKLKIPWKNLYNERTIAELDGLYLVAVPTISEFLHGLDFKT